MLSKIETCTIALNESFYFYYATSFVLLIPFGNIVYDLVQKYGGKLTVANFRIN